MFNQLLKILKTVGIRNQISAAYIVLLTFLIVFLELLSFTLLIPAISILLDVTSLDNNRILIFIKSMFIFDTQSYYTLNNIIISIVLVISLKLVLLLYFEYKLGRVMWQIQVDINTKIYRYFTIIPLPEMIKSGMSRVRRLISTDATLFVRQGFYNYILLIKNLILFTALFYFLLQIDIKATIIIFLSASAFVLLFNKIFRNQSIVLSKLFKQLTEFKHNNVNETILGIREIKLFNNEEIVTDIFEKNERKISVADIQKKVINKIPRLLLEFLVVVALAIFIYFFNKESQNIIDILPKVTLLALVLLRVMPVATGINGNLLAIKYSKVPIDDVIERLISLENQELEKANNSNKLFNLKKNQKLELKHMSFSHNKEAKNIFKNLNVEFEENKITGIQGDNGSGKSTLVDLVAGFLKPTSGSILFNEQSIFDNLKEWRKIIGYVSQMHFLKNDTIKNNIVFSGNNKIDQGKLEEVITQSGVKDFLHKMSDGIDTEVGDLGIKLSGGQKQRITIARVLYRNPKIIILDEPTSAQDNKIEKSFLNVIQKIKNEKIIILISHSKFIHSICDINYRVENNTLIKVKNN